MLCSICSGIYVRSGFMETNWGDKRWPISALSEDSNCELCRTLHGMFVRTPGHRAYRNGVAQGVIPSSWGSTSLKCHKFSLEFIDETGRRGPLYSSYVLQLVHSAAAGRKFENLQFDAKLVGDWLQHCGSKHDCVHGYLPQKRNAGFYVIDVEDMCIIRAYPTCQYVALSYVWGGVKQLRLQKNNVERLEMKGSLNAEQIPQTIQDAIAICLSLGLRYLWVDRLCILQDSAGHSNRQVAHMYQIYSGAYFTIIAGTGGDSSSGIFAARPNKRIQHTARFSNAMYVAVPEGLKPLETSIESSTWASRAWTMQEFVLSRRCLIFTGNDCFLYCGQGAYVPGLSKNKLLPPPERYGTSLLSHRLPYWRGEGIIHRRYARLASEYMSRELSFPKDILRAFEGIARLLTPYLGKFREGLPEGIIRWALCWMHTGPMKRRPGFPTWAWAGWKRIPDPSGIKPRFRTWTWAGTDASKPDTEGSASQMQLGSSAWTWTGLQHSRNGIHAEAPHERVILSFPDDYAHQFWPPCSIYYWTSNMTMKQIPSRVGSQESKRPNFEGNLELVDNCICENARWIWNVQSLRGKRCSNRSYKRLLSIKSPAFKNVEGVKLEHILTFASCYASLSRQPKRATGKRKPLEPIPVMATSSAFEDRILDEELQGSPKLRQTYVFLGLLNHPSKLFAVIVPVSVDHLAPGTNGDADQLVVRRCGNPCRLDAMDWFKDARKCIVHYR